MIPDEQELQESGEKEVGSSVVGEKIMQLLKKLDDVAYIRFASVYRQFKDINEFIQELQGMVNNNQK